MIRVLPSGDEASGLGHDKAFVNCSAGELRSTGIQKMLIGPLRFEAKAMRAPSLDHTGVQLRPPEASRSQEPRARARIQMPESWEPVWTARRRPSGERRGSP